MIVQFIVKNYKSFKEAVTLSMVAALAPEAQRR
jgi:AAA15 family ATPase/GTPase